MNLGLHAGFDLARIGAVSITLTDGGGGPIVVSLGVGRFAHMDLSGVMGAGEYDQFDDAFEAAINAAPTIQNDYSLAFNPTTFAYTLSKAAGTFTLAAPTGVARNVLGLSTGGAGLTTISSNLRPYYAIRSAHGKTDATDDYEPDDVVEGGHTTGGGVFAITAASGITMNDFVLPLEAKPAVFQRSALAAVPWTYEHFWKHVRGTEPFALVNSVASETDVMFMRASAARFRPQRVVASYDGLWNLEFRCYLEGRL